MRIAYLALGAAALTTGTLAQDAEAPASSWAYFEGEGGLLQAGVQAAGGEQLILKCDETGDGEVFAVIYSPERLKPPSSRPQPRSILLAFDGGRREEHRWRYYEQTVLALNTRRDRNLPPFLNDLVDANELEVGLEPVDGSPIQFTLTVTGAREAINRVYESCQDGDNPIG